MTTRPILFSAAMVQALLTGRKTVTRRLIQSAAKNMQREGMRVIQRRAPGDPWYKDHVWSMRGESSVWGDYTEERFLELCPYGKPGDTLWVKETWRPEVSHHCAMDACDCASVYVHYAAGGGMFVSEYTISDYEDRPGGKDWFLPQAAKRGKNVSPLFMPRFASRLTLTLTSRRAEALHDLTEEDAVAEGFAASEGRSARDNFAAYWDKLHGTHKGARWDANPFVWRLGFDVAVNDDVDGLEPRS